MILSDHHYIRARWAELLKVILNNERRNIFSSSSDNQFLDSSSDVNKAIFVNLSQITTVKVSEIVDCLSGSLLILKISHHDVSASENNFSVAFLIWVINFKICAAQSVPN